MNDNQGIEISIGSQEDKAAGYIDAAGSITYDGLLQAIETGTAEFYNRFGMAATHIKVPLSWWYAKARIEELLDESNLNLCNTDTTHTSPNKIWIGVMDKTTMTESQALSYRGYDPDLGILKVKMRRNNMWVVYEGIGLEIATAFWEAPSIGQFYNDNIKGKYELRVDLMEQLNAKPPIDKVVDSDLSKLGNGFEHRIYNNDVEEWQAAIVALAKACHAEGINPTYVTLAASTPKAVKTWCKEMGIPISSYTSRKDTAWMGDANIELVNA